MSLRVGWWADTEAADPQCWRSGMCGWDGRQVQNWPALCIGGLESEGRTAGRCRSGLPSVHYHFVGFVLEPLMKNYNFELLNYY